MRKKKKKSWRIRWRERFLTLLVEHELPGMTIYKKKPKKSDSEKGESNGEVKQPKNPSDGLGI